MRFWFGSDIAAYVINTITIGSANNVAQLVGGAAVTFWTSETGGTQYIDLLDSQGNAITFVVAADGSPGGRAVGVLPPFRGPDDVKRMWAQAGAGPRILITTNDFDNLVPSPEMILPPMTVAGAVTGPATGLSRLYNDTSMTLQILAVRASVGVAPSGPLILDVRRNGSSIFSLATDRPTIAGGAFTSGRIEPAETVTLAPDDYLTADVVSGTSGGALVIQATVTRAAV